MSEGAGLAINASPVGVSTNGELRLKTGHRDGFRGLENLCRVRFRLSKHLGFLCFSFSLLTDKVINDKSIWRKRINNQFEQLDTATNENPNHVLYFFRLLMHKKGVA